MKTTRLIKSIPPHTPLRPAGPPPFHMLICEETLQAQRSGPHRSLRPHPGSSASCGAPGPSPSPALACVVPPPVSSVLPETELNVRSLGSLR